VEYHEETGSKVHRFILFEKHAGNNAVNRMEKTVQERAVIQEKNPKLLINGKHTMPMGNMNQFKGHRGSALHGIEIPAGRTETAVAAEGDELKLPAVRAAKHCAAKGRITAVNHFSYIFYHRLARV
jgi:hypothetical protein